MADTQNELFVTILRAHGHQVTKARSATFKLLQSPDPQTMQQLLVKAGQMVDRVSVYRNIALFEELGIVQRLTTGWKYSLELTDQFTGHHHHLTCLQCDKVIDIADEQHIDDFIAELAHIYQFHPRRHQFEIDGYCADCAKT